MMLSMFGLFGNTATAKKDLRDRKTKQNQAPEQILVSGRTVKIVRRPYKRSLGLTLKLNGEIRVSAPKGVPLSKIHDFVSSQDLWIQTHLEKYKTLREAHPKKHFCEGEQLPYMGRTLTLTFEPVGGGKRPCMKVRGEELVCEIRKELWHLFDPKAAHPELRSGFCAFYQKQARELLVSRVRNYAMSMGLVPTGLSFRAQKTRWGSCSSRGKISLNWKLIIAPIEVIDYVVVHELAHLKYYNHSKSFWDLVGTQVADFRVKREWLRDHQFDADFLSAQSELW
jgi:predicted metal-dependent hydrolase